jgi:hypothetical protein
MVELLAELTPNKRSTLKMPHRSEGTVWLSGSRDAAVQLKLIIYTFETVQERGDHHVRGYRAHPITPLLAAYGAERSSMPKTPIHAKQPNSNWAATIPRLMTF